MKYALEHPVVARIGKEKYTCTVEWRNGKFIVDEPETSGGKDKGPDPYTLMLASLGTCTLATLRMYIDRKEWDIPKIAVAVNLFQEVVDRIALAQGREHLSSTLAQMEVKTETVNMLEGSCGQCLVGIL